MMKRQIYLTIAFAAFVLSVCSAGAETRYRFEFFGAGNIIPADSDFQVSVPIFDAPLDGEERFRNGVRGGIRFGVDGVGYWGQEFSYSYGHNTTTFIVNPPSSSELQDQFFFDELEPFEFAFTSRSHQFAYNVLLYPAGYNERGFIPYLTAGLGATIFTASHNAVNKAKDIELGQLESHTSFAFNVGVGMRYQFNDNWGLRFDWRDWMSHPPRYGIPKSSDDPNKFVLPVNGIFHQMEVSVGFVYSFRSPK